MSTMRYGDGTTYGAVGLTYGEQTIANRRITFGLVIDWDNDGVLTGENEATNRLLNWSERRGREFVFNSSGDGFNHPSAGEISFDMLDIDGRYDPYNASGELYSYLYGNQKLQFFVKDEVTGDRFVAFTGYITDIRPNYGTPNKTTIYASDGRLKLENKKIRSSVVTSQQYEDRISAALTEADWTDGTEIDTTSSDTLPYHWFSGKSAADEIDDLADATFGVFFIDMEGNAVYKSSLIADASTQSLTEADIDYQYRIKAPAPRDVIRNLVTVFARSRTAVSAVEIWRMAEKPQLLVGENNAVWAEFTYNGVEAAATSVTEPAATTDYTANDAQDGSGTVRTGNLSFVMTAFATSAKLVPTVSSGTPYLTLLKLRGNIITTDEYTFSEESDAASIASYGERSLTIKTNWLQSLNTAQEQAALLLGKFAQPKAFPRIKFKRSSISKQYTSDLFDLVTLNFSTFGVTGEFRVGYIERSWSISEPSAINTITYFEPNLTVSASSSWTFPMTFPTIFAT